MNLRSNCRLRNTTFPYLSLAAVLWVPAFAPAVAQQAEASQALAGARQVFDGTMLPSVEVNTFSHSDTLFPVNIVKRGGAVRPFAYASEAEQAKVKKIHFQSQGQKFDLYDYLAFDRVAGLLILKDGKVAFEDYELGTSPETHWISFSMAKSISSTLVGAAIQQGLIASIDDPVTKYVAGLKGGVYDDVSVRNLLQMASGVQWDETYTDPRSDRRKLLDLQLAGKPGSIVAYMKKLPRAGAPGTIWNYSTGESFLVGALIEGATHKPLATYLSETLWSRLGMERDATWWLESTGGMGLAGSGLGATLRDYARFGEFVLHDGVIEHEGRQERLVPEGWFAEAGKAQMIGGKKVDYGYLWWPMEAGDPIHEGAFEAVGIFGQHMYINPREKLVIVVLSARPKPDADHSPVDDGDFFAAVARALQ
ncbi:MAG: serine hydrolase [Terracidiphilus sp.]|jgi:CubicO group peptidase (beta-lactamase class C family)